MKFFKINKLKGDCEMFFNFNSFNWFLKSRDLDIEILNGKLHITNKGDRYVNILCLKPFKFKKDMIEFESNGHIEQGFCEFNIIDLKMQKYAIFDFQEKSSAVRVLNTNFLVLRVYPESILIVDNFSIKECDSIPEENVKVDTDLLIITPSYPSRQNRYLGGFVHSRVVEYKNRGINCSVACIYDYPVTVEYEYEGIQVLKGNFSLLDAILMNSKFKTICVHFFDERYGKILDRFDLSSTKMFFFIHGPETLYKDWNYFVTPYFKRVEDLSESQIKLNKVKDEYIRRYSNMSNVQWVFVSEWIKEHSEKLIGIKFNNYSVIPNFIDTENFKYIEKDQELRKSIFILRRFDNINKYAIDINIRTIMYLSKSKEFKDMEFYIYGDGNCHSELVKPIKDFKNVHFYKKFLDHKEIYNAHKKCGIALFATRYDAQGVSMCEAMSSGLVVLSNRHDAIKEFIPEQLNTLSDMNDYKDMATKILYFYNNPKEYSNVSKKMSDCIREKCSFEATIKKEIDLLLSEQPIKKEEIINEEISLTPVLSVIIPSYNVGKTLSGTINSLLTENKYNYLVEVIVVNDGSVDNTLEVAERCKKRYSKNGKSCVKILNKENGGHGSTINEGIKIAKGKYVKIVDGDDTLITSNFERLLKILQYESTDVVLCDFCRDFINSGYLEEVNLYEFMESGYEYGLDDVCDEYYGFQIYGPVLATSCIKTDILKSYDLKLSEKKFYVDMEFNAKVVLACNTVKYYPILLYKYKIGKESQSISKKSYIKRYLDHEAIIFKIIDLIENTTITRNKRNFIINKIIIPMIRSHKIIYIDYMNDKDKYDKFIQEVNKKISWKLE